MEKLIKGVDKESWREFKVESIKHNMKMGEFLTRLLEEHKNAENSNDSWKFLENRRTTISQREAEQVKKILDVFEKETEFE